MCSMMFPMKVLQGWPDNVVLFKAMPDAFINYSSKCTNCMTAMLSFDPVMTEQLDSVLRSFDRIYFTSSYLSESWQRCPKDKKIRIKAELFHWNYSLQMFLSPTMPSLSLVAFFDLLLLSATSAIPLTFSLTLCKQELCIICVCK